MIECPMPHSRYTHIVMAHGGGGRLTDSLIKNVFTRHFGETDRHDSAFLPACDKEMVMTTDSFVVDPIFFPGGDIGKLAVYGTVNDISVSGAKPAFLSLAFILEEGLELETLEKVCASIAACARECDITIVTGDTKVVERGAGGGIYINSTGIGYIRDKRIEPSRIRPGDAIIVSADIGRHAMAVMACREKLEFDPPIESDAATLYPAIESLRDGGVDLHCVRDLTRGGLASSLNELSDACDLSFVIEKESLPVDPSVKSSCELLGLNPLTMAGEGVFVAFISREQKDRALILLSDMGMIQATVIGHVGKSPGPVTSINALGVEQIIERPFGDQLPRIC